MMKGHSINQWVLQGHLYIWHYRKTVKGLEGWHLSADRSACSSLSDLLHKMLLSESGTKKSLQVSTPVKMPIGGGNAWESVSTLDLCHPQGEVESTHWHLELIQESKLILTVGSRKLQELDSSLAALSEGRDDFLIGPEVNWKRENNRAERERFQYECLWFWAGVQ